MKNPEESRLGRGGPNLPCRRLPGTADQAQWASQVRESQQIGGDFAIRPVDQFIQPIVHDALHPACLERPRTAARHLSTCVLALTSVKGRLGADLLPRPEVRRPCGQHPPKTATKLATDPSASTPSLWCRRGKMRVTAGLPAHTTVIYSRHLIEVVSTGDFDQWLRILQDRVGRLRTHRQACRRPSWRCQTSRPGRLGTTPDVRSRLPGLLPTRRTTGDSPVMRW